jgi:hypothetical protein
MSEDDYNTDEMRPDLESDDRTDPADSVDWTAVSADPDPEDLGYDCSEWERIPVDEDDQVVFLPGNEEDIEDNAFVVLDDRDLCDLVSNR